MLSTTVEAIWERIEQPSVNKKGGLRTRHFMVFLVAFHHVHMTSPKGQLPDENVSVATLCVAVGSLYRFITSF